MINVLVCGSNYGASYIRALAGGSDGVRLAGILSRGSARSRFFARRSGVAHFTAVDQIPRDSIDLACVTVPGESGLQIALDLLALGKDVLCEHPLGPEQVSRALTMAKKHGRVFHVNAHFGDLQAPQAFFHSLAIARQNGPVMQYEMSLNLRTLYSALDILGRAHGNLAEIEVIPPLREEDRAAPFCSLLLVSPELRATLLCQNFASECDDGSACLINHRFSAIFKHGNLLLAESHGPVIWFPSPVSMFLDSWRNYLAVDMTVLDVNGLQQHRDLANRQAILNLIACTQNKAAQAPYQQPEYLLNLASLWQRVLQVLQAAPLARA